jgi:hypothetical protein
LSGRKIESILVRVPPSNNIEGFDELKEEENQKYESLERRYQMLTSIVQNIQSSLHSLDQSGKKKIAKQLIKSEY